MPGIKELKIRIKSIGSTRKITRAMQVVSAAKMRKAQNAVLESRLYASLASELVESVAKQDAIEHPLIRRYPEAKKIGIVLLTSNRGLVGSLNANLIMKIKEIHNNHNDNNSVDELSAEIISYGKKGQILSARLKKNIVADFPKADRVISVEDIYPLAKFVSDSYAAGQYKKIIIVYSHFVSTLSQKAMIRQLLPFIHSVIPAKRQPEPESSSQTINSIKNGRMNLNAELGSGMTQYRNLDTGVIYEPAPQAVIQYLIPRIIESQIYQTILESDASEHSARMVMMKNATEAAGDLISDLTLTYNQLRQNKITTELAEITAGKIALE